MVMYREEFLMLEETRLILETVYSEQGGDSMHWANQPLVYEILLLAREIRKNQQEAQ